MLEHVERGVNLCVSVHCFGFVCSGFLYQAVPSSVESGCACKAFRWRGNRIN